MKINWAGWIINIICYLMTVAALFLFTNHTYGMIMSIMIFIICICTSITQASKRGIPTIVKDDKKDSEFTTEDYINCKVGEWLTR